VLREYGLEVWDRENRLRENGLEDNWPGEILIQAVTLKFKFYPIPVNVPQASGLNLIMMMMFT
jgi:hypothetical protein